MRKPLIYSGTIHVALILVTIFGLPARKLEPVETRAIPVQLLTVADITNLRRLAKKLPKTPKPVEQPAPPKPEEKPQPVVKAAHEPAAEPEEAKPEEKAELVPDKTAEAPKPEEKKPEPPKPEKKKPTPEKEKPKKKKLTFAEQMQATLNKVKATPTEEAPAEEAKEDLQVDKTDDPTLPVTVSEIDGFRQKVQKCWDAGNLVGALDADKMYADLSFELAEDGSVVGIPQIDDVGPAASRVLAERARKAILACAPYDNLPRASYQNWKDGTAHFTLDGMM